MKIKNTFTSSLHHSITLFLLFFIASPVFALTPNDSLFQNQWYLEKIHASQAWDTRTDAHAVVVAILDTGFDTDHPDLADNVWTNPSEIPNDHLDNDHNGFVDDVNGYDFVDDDGQPSPEPDLPFDPSAVPHGTVVAGIVGAVGNNAKGIAGINWNVRLMNVRILDNEGVGSSTTARKGIEYAVKNGAKIINLSFTGFDDDPRLKEAVKTAYDAGVVIVAAVGNKNDGGIDIDTKPIYPACYGDEKTEDWVLGVAATNANDGKTTFSNYGSCVDISAPGEDIISTVYQNDAWSPFAKGFYQKGWSGTSMASPMIAGSAALLKAYRPALKPDQIKLLLRLSVDPIHETGPASGKMGSGRVNIASAMALAGQLFPDEAIAGSLVKLACGKIAPVDDPCHAVYFYGGDGKRHAFPNDKVFFTWYTDFESVKEVSATFLSSLALGKNVTYHPGTKLVKFQSVPTVYAVSAKGSLHAVGSESIAAELYGKDWNKKVDDISDAFFGNYTLGFKIEFVSDYSVSAAIESVHSLVENF